MFAGSEGVLTYGAYVVGCLMYVNFFLSEALYTVALQVAPSVQKLALLVLQRL